MTDRTSSVTLQWNTDNASLQKIKQAVTDIQGRLKSLNAEGTKGSATFERYSEVLKVIGRNQDIEDITKDFVKLSKVTNDNVSALRDLRSALREIGASESEINKATRAFKEMQQEEKKTKGGVNVGRLESRVGRAGASLTGLGLGDVGGAVSGVADVLQLVEVIQNLAPAAQIATIATTGASGSFVALAVAATPFIAIGAAIVATLLILKKGLDDLNKVVEPAAKAASHASKELDAYYDAIRLGSKETIEAKRKQLADDKILLEEELKTRKEALKPFEGFFGTLASVSQRGVYDELNKSVQDTEEQLKSAQAQLDGYTRAVNSSAVAVMEAARAEEARHNATVDNFSQQTQGQLEIYDLMKSGSAEQVKALIARKKFEKDLIAEEVANLNVVADSNEAAAKRIEELETNGKQLDKSLESLILTVLPLIEARDKEAEAIADQKRIIDEVIKATQDYNADVKTVTERGVTEELAIKQRAVERIADVVQKELDASNAAFEKLENQRSELLEGFNEDTLAEDRRAQLEDLDQQLEAQRDERDALISHQRRIQQMRRSFLVQERDALLDRNFLELFRIQENKKLQEQEAGDELKQEKEDRNRAFADERQDTARHRSIERSERIQALNKALALAQKGYETEIRQAQQAKQHQINLLNQATTRELNTLAAKINNELSLRQSTYSQELQLASLTKDARLALLEAERQAVLSQALRFGYVPRNPAVEGTVGGSLGNTQGGRSNFFAEGGTIRRGQFGVINDGFKGQRESVDGVPFPPGMALIQALETKRINPGPSNGGMNITQQFSVSANTASDAQAIARKLLPMVRSETYKVMREVTGNGTL